MNLIPRLCVMALLMLLAAGCTVEGKQSSEEAEPPPVPREPTTEEVVRAFEAEGLEVGEYYDVADDPQWGTGMLPKTMDSGTRFEMPSYARGQEPPVSHVFHFATPEDQRVVSDYLETVGKNGGMFYTHVYETDGFLLKIDGSVPKNVADSYGSVLEKATD